MTTLNSYATLAEYKAYTTARGQTATTDTADDAVIESLLKAISRYVDAQTARWFYPRIETRYFDVPYSRELIVDADLLEVLSITNGDGTLIPSTEYSLRPRNQSPHFIIRLVDNSTYYWASDGSGNTHDVIEVTGVWGYHNRYSVAWETITTLAEDLDTSETGIDVTSGTNFSAGNIVRIGDELSYISTIVTNTLTGTRGENGSTAASHLTGVNVRVWQFMDELKTATLETALQAYRRRFGQSGTNQATITAAGVVLSPKDIPTIMVDFLNIHRRYV